MMATLNLTDNERALLKAILNSEYHDSVRDEAKIGNPVWVDCLWGFEGKAKFGGTMASLSKKGLAATDGECAWLTADGYIAAKEIA